MIFTSISYLLFLPLIVVAYYLWPGRIPRRAITPPPAPPLGGEWSSFIPIFFALIGVLVVGNYFGGRWLYKANEQGNGKQALTIPSTG